MSIFSSVAFLTGSVGTGEWVVLFVVVLIVVGPKRLPEIARKLGRTMEMFRRAADEFKDQLMSMDQEPSTSAPAAPSATDADGVSSSAEPASDDYANLSDYPGNEGQVENWHPETQLGQPAAETPSSGSASVPPEDKPAEGGS